MLSAFVTGLVLGGILMIAGATMVGASKLADLAGWRRPVTWGCLATIVVLVSLAIVAFQILAP